MRYAAEVAEPISDVRDVVETFRRYGVEAVDWREVVISAIVQLERTSVSEGIKAPWADHLTGQLHELVRVGLTQGDSLLETIAEEIHSLISSTRVPGIPRPEDENWEF